MSMTNVPIPEPGPKPPPMPPPPFPGQPVREPDPQRLPDEEPLPNPDENDEPPQHAGTEDKAGFTDSEAFERFAREIGSRSRYVRSAESQRFLDAVAATSGARVRSVDAGTIYWRAQVGHGWQRDGAGGRKVRGPHPRERMKPLSDRAYEGRVNPKGIPCLYFATSREVAISEVRPWLGSEVTVARFRTLSDMELVDCTSHEGVSGGGAADIEKAVWAAIDRAFSRPVIETDNKAEYAATQAVAEVLRDRGFDGVIYRSAYAGEGRNVALFDLDAAEVVDQALFEICDISLEFQEIEPEKEE